MSAGSADGAQGTRGTYAVRYLWNSSMNRNDGQLVREFGRYLVVGGFAFIVDFLVLSLAYELVLKQVDGGIYIATGVGFAAGLAVNYLLSIHFVFSDAKGTELGRSFKDLIVFALVGIIGLGISELGMWLGFGILHGDYRLIKILVTGIVLLWNYGTRKLLIFNKGLLK